MRSLVVLAPASHSLDLIVTRTLPSQSGHTLLNTTGLCQRSILARRSPLRLYMRVNRRTSRGVPLETRVKQLRARGSVSTAQRDHGLNSYALLSAIGRLSVELLRRETRVYELEGSGTAGLGFARVTAPNSRASRRPNSCPSQKSASGSGWRASEPTKPSQCRTRRRPHSRQSLQS